MVGCKTEVCHLPRNDITNILYEYTCVLSVIHETCVTWCSCINCSLEKFFDLDKGGHRERQGRKYSLESSDGSKIFFFKSR